jgi:hypothetical protein
VASNLPFTVQNHSSDPTAEKGAYTPLTRGFLRDSYRD